MANFEAQVSKWAKKSEARMTAVFRDAAQQVANDVRIPVAQGGNMPVLTGNLRRSLQASNSEMPRLQSDNKVKFDQEEPIVMVIAQTELGGTIYLGFQAVYAPFQEARRGFVRLTAQRWQAIVRASAAKVRKAVGGPS